MGQGKGAVRGRRAVTILRGIWHWTGPIEQAIKIAKDAGGNTIISKAAYQEPIYSDNLVRRGDFPANARKVRDAGLLLAAEVYCMPGSALAEADALRWAVQEHGAASIVLNMEGPYEAEPNGNNVKRLVERFGGLVPIYASTDFRGNRLSLSYHKELAKYVAGWLVMIYPKAFYPNTPFGDLQMAFDDAYWRWQKLGPALPEPGRNAPLLPAIQTYGRMDYEEVAGQIILAWKWTTILGQKVHGTSLYAAHDCNDRAKWGARDAWEIVDLALQPGRPVMDVDKVVTAVSKAAGDAARQVLTG